MSEDQTTYELIELSAPLWRWTGSNGVGWYFITIDGAAGDLMAATAMMRKLELGHARGFGMIKVIATIGKSRWKTSAFPSNEVKGYLLPVKAAVRKTEAITEGDIVNLVLEF